MLYKSLVIKISIPPEKKTKQKEYLEIGLLPIVDQGKEIIGGYTNEVEKNIVCNLPVIVFGDHTCSVKYINFPFGAGADGIKILKAKDNVLPQYLFYGTQYLVFHLHDRGYARHYQHIEKMDLYVPPIEEQRRIVSRIEELFSELDSAVETLQKTRQQLEIYRQAVLKEAFENIDIRNYVKLGKIIEKPRYGTSKKCTYDATDSSTAVYRIPNINYEKGILDRTDLKYAEFDSNELNGIDLKENDILLIRSNGSVSLVGRTAIVNKKDVNNTFAGYLIRIRLFEPSTLKTKFLHYYLQSYQARYYIENTAKSTSGVNNINAEEIKKLVVPNCDDEFIAPVISNIESRLSVCAKIERTVDEAMQQAEAMRQSILKKAFEGGFY